MLAEAGNHGLELDNDHSISPGQAAQEHSVMALPSQARPSSSQLRVSRAPCGGSAYSFQRRRLIRCAVLVACLTE